MPGFVAAACPPLGAKIEQDDGTPASSGDEPSHPIPSTLSESQTLGLLGLLPDLSALGQNNSCAYYLTLVDTSAASQAT
ncbi:hypothetical protein NUW54_g7168 [Trametes sanguinea]|uniref:Uncharacterized protein n=1 Tax=Trametes sanguinea TaxID=158606 RepID=A0ACC1PQQ8_9APHY|nr:hypothetical protein NUW54_g7168 [Trametes sanguinea]